MDARKAEQALAEVRLRAALAEHIEEVEPYPVEVSQAVREMYQNNT